MPREPSPRRPDQEPARDVLAAEAFAVPAPDPELQQRPFVPPEDPSGIAEPHDILAAEEFAMPAGRPATQRRRIAGGGPPARRVGLAAAAAGLLALLGRRRRGR
jgi:hypothetical protein